jgi:glycosyltransferase involved in cell wall biosynthesis
LTIAGDGPERTRLEELAADLGLQGRARFCGWVSPRDIPHLISSATCLVLSSDREGLPRVGLEAALLARPLIATCVGGVSELVVTGQTGLLTPPGDVEALAQAMRYILTHPARAAEMGRAAQNRAEALFRFDQVVDAFAALYARLAHSSLR